MESRANLLAGMRRHLLGPAEVRGSVCLLSGAAGSGKTHLAERLLRHPPDGAAVLSGRGLPTGTPALLPICKALGSGDPRTLEQLAAVVHEYAAALPVLREVLAPLLRARRSTRYGLAASRDFVPSETHTFVALTHVLRCMSIDRPLVLFLDDIQWLDASSVAFLGHLLTELDRVPLRLLLAARTNGTEPACIRSLRDVLGRTAPDVSLELKIPQLSYEEVTDVAARALKAPLDASTESIRWLHHTSRGNPQYLSEVVRLLQRDAVIVCGRGRWRFVQTPPQFVLPPTLEAITQRRLDGVIGDDADAAQVVQYAAVCGATFDVTFLAHVLGIPRQRLSAMLAGIGRQTGYLHRATERGCFSFDHDLTREAVLAGIGDGVSAIHLHIAEELEAVSRVEPLRIAGHFRHAHAYERAAAHYGRARALAAERGAILEAADAALSQDDMLAQAGIPSDDERRLVAIMAHAEALVQAERFAQAVAVLEPRIPSSPHPLGSALVHSLGRARARIGDQLQEHRAVAELRDALRRTAPKDAASRASILADLVHAQDTIGDYDGSRAAYRAARSLARTTDQPALLVRLLRLACMFWQPEKVVEQTAIALAHAKAHGLGMEVAYCENNLGTAWLRQRDFDRASHHFRRAREQLRRYGDFRTEAPLNNLGIIDLVRGNLAEAGERFREAAERAQNQRNRLLIRSNLAVLRARLGDTTGAEAELRALVVDTNLTADSFYRDCAHQNWAGALLLLGEASAAIDAATAHPPRHLGSDDALILGQRARLLLRALHSAEIDLPNGDLAAAAAVLDRTTKPHAWLYREPWVLCDIEFWSE